MVAAGMAAETSQRFQGVYDESPRQFKLNGVIDLYKAILLMTPRRSLLHGGLQELQLEQARPEMTDSSITRLLQTRCKMVTTWLLRGCYVAFTRPLHGCCRRARR